MENIWNSLVPIKPKEETTINTRKITSHKRRNAIIKYNVTPPLQITLTLI